MSLPPRDIVGTRLGQLRPYRTSADPAPVKLDANESPWPLPDAARARLAEVLAQAPLHRYPDLMARDLRAALAQRLGARGEELVLGVGSDEIIGMLMAAFDRPREGAARATVLFPSPSFVMYPITATVHGLEPHAIPLTADWALDLDAMRDAIHRLRPNLVFVASPNNPTGNDFGDEALSALVDAAPDALVVLDEAYAPFSARTRGDWARTRPNVGVMGTLSKIGLAGLRLGWIRMHPELVAEAEKARSPYNVNALTQAAAELFLREMPEVLSNAVERITDERARVQRGLADLPGLTAFPSDANFILVEVDDAPALHAALLTRGVQVRLFGGEPRLARHLRITVGTPEENDALLDALRHATRREP